MALVTLPELQRKLQELITLGKAVSRQRDRRAGGWRVYLSARELLQEMGGSVAQDEPETAAFVAKAVPLLEGRLKALEEADAFNPVTVQIHERTELDLLLLRKKLEDEDWRVRLDAVAAPGELAYTDAQAALLERLEVEEHPFVLSKLTKVIGQLGGEPVLVPLTRFLTHEDERVRANTVEGLAALSGEEKYVALMPLLEDPAPRVRASTLKAIQALGGERFASMVRRMICHEDPAHRRSVLHVLASLKTPLGHECLRVLFEDRDAEIRGRAIELMGRRPSMASVEALVSFMQTECGETTRGLTRDALRALRQSIPEKGRARMDAHLKRAIDERVASPGEAEPPASEGDLLDQLAAVLRPRPRPERSPRPPPAAREPQAPQDTEEAEARKAQELKKVLARLGSFLSTLGPRERREAEKMIRSGKATHESQLRTAMQRLRRKRR